MYLDLGEPVEGLHHGLVRQLKRLLHALALDHLGGHAARGYGRTAPEGLELAIADDPVLIDVQEDPHDVSALRVPHGPHAGRVLDLADIAGIREVVDDLVAVNSVVHLMPPLPSVP